MYGPVFSRRLEGPAAKDVLMEWHARLSTYSDETLGRTLTWFAANGVHGPPSLPFFTTMARAFDHTVPFRSTTTDRSTPEVAAKHIAEARMKLGDITQEPGVTPMIQTKYTIQTEDHALTLVHRQFSKDWPDQVLVTILEPMELGKRRQITLATMEIHHVQALRNQLDAILSHYNETPDSLHENNVDTV